MSIIYNGDYRITIEKVVRVVPEPIKYSQPLPEVKPIKPSVICCISAIISILLIAGSSAGIYANNEQHNESGIIACSVFLVCAFCCFSMTIIGSCILFTNSCTKDKKESITEKSSLVSKPNETGMNIEAVF